MISSLLSNKVLVMGLTAWFLAQVIKIPVEYFRTRTWNWSLVFSPGGMPSSHSALVTATAHGIGLVAGFDTPLFAVAVALAMIVIYDATGIRRQAGRHALIINAMIRDLASGHPLRQEQLREVLGHTPLEALGGLIFGFIVAQVIWLFWQ